MLRMVALAILSSVATSPIPPAESSPPEAWDDSDIVVVAEKLRKVKIDYSARGKKLFSCDVTQSSGDARIDRIMCAILNACVKSGAQSRFAAKNCINDRISALENEPITRAPQGSESEIPDANSQPTSVASDITKTENNLAHPSADHEQKAHAPPSQEIDTSIIVTAKPNPIRAGQWEFHQEGRSTSMTGARFLPTRRWRICIPDSTLEQTVDSMLRDAIEVDFVPDRCNRWDIKLADGKITGEQRCVPKFGMRMMGDLEGSVTSDRVTIIRHVRLVSVTGRASANDEQDSAYEINGTRIGSCGKK